MKTESFSSSFFPFPLCFALPCFACQSPTEITHTHSLSFFRSFSQSTRRLSRKRETDDSIVKGGTNKRKINEFPPKPFHSWLFFCAMPSLLVSISRELARLTVPKYQLIRSLKTLTWEHGAHTALGLFLHYIYIFMCVCGLLWHAIHSAIQCPSSFSPPFLFKQMVE